MAYIIKNISNSEKIEKTIKVLDKLLGEENEILETMIVIQVFQKIYPLKNAIVKFREFLTKNTLEIFDQYLIEYNKPIELHPSLKNLGDSREVIIDIED